MNNPLLNALQQQNPSPVPAKKTKEQKLAEGLLKGAKKGYREGESKRPLGFGEARRVAKAKLKAPSYQDVVESALHMSAKTKDGQPMRENTPVTEQDKYRVDPVTRDRIIKEFADNPEAATKKYTAQRDQWRAWREQSGPAIKRMTNPAPISKAPKVSKAETDYRQKQVSGGNVTLEEVQAAERGGYNRPYTAKSEEEQALALAPNVKGFAQLDHRKPAKRYTETAEGFVKALVDGADQLVSKLPDDPFGVKQTQKNALKTGAFLVGQTLMTPVRVESALNYMHDPANPPFDRAMSALGMLLDIEGAAGGPISSPFISGIARGGWRSAKKFIKSFGKAALQSLAKITGNSEEAVESIFAQARKAVDEVPEAEGEALFDSHDLVKNLEKPVAEEPKLPTREAEALQESELRERLSAPDEGVDEAPIQGHGVKTTRFHPDGTTEEVSVLPESLSTKDGQTHIGLDDGTTIPLDEVLPPAEDLPNILEKSRRAKQTVSPEAETGVETPPVAQTAPETPEAPLRGVQEPIEASPGLTGSAKAKQEFQELWKEILQDASETNIGSGLGGLTPGQIKAVSKLPALALKGLEYGFKTAVEFAEWAGKNIGAWAKDHAFNAWEKVHGGDFGMAAKYEPAGSLPGVGVSVKSLAERGAQLILDGKVNPDTVYKTAPFKGSVSPDEIAAIAYRGTFVKNRAAEIEAKMIAGGLDDAELALLNLEHEGLETEMANILEVANVAQKTFHETGQALQVAFNKTYEPVEVMARAKANNFGGDIPENLRTKLDEGVEGVKKSRAKVSEEATKTKEKVEKMVNGPGVKVQGPKKQVLLDGLNSNLGLGKYKGFQTKNKGKTSGSLFVPPDKERQMSVQVNGLIREYINDGAKSLDDVVNAFIKDVPALSKDDVLFLINREYKDAVLTMDVHKAEIEKALRDIKKQALDARRTDGEKFIHAAGDGVVSFGRQMQSGLDTSLSFIQGLPGLQISPTSWGKAWVPWFKVAFAKKGKGEWEFLHQNIKLHQDPVFGTAKKMGVGFTDSYGAYNVQEEAVVGHLLQKAREAKNPVVRTYFEALARSQDASVAFMNQMRLDLFKKFVAGNWTDEASLRDAAALTNIVTGRGNGKMADALAAKPFAYVAYAPRYAWSKYQNSALPILIPTVLKSSAGRKAAASVWTKQTVAAYLAAPVIAKSLGMDVDLDLRSGQYGAITLPNGGKLRLFKHFTEPLSTLYQLANGRISKSGNLQKPGYGSSAIAGQYITGKLSPAGSTLWQQIANNRYDDETGKGVETRNPKEWLGALGRILIPLSVQAMGRSIKERDALGVFLGLMGIDYDPSKSKTKSTDESADDYEFDFKEDEDNSELDKILKELE